jgi:EKC/KEOPS complex subunit CGI121/TPRKB
MRTSRAKTRTPHSELVFRLHPNNNIGESYRKFGISDTTSSLIAVKLALTSEWTSERVSEHLGEHVKGESVDPGESLENVGMWCDVAKVRRIYKLAGVAEMKSEKKSAAVNGNAKELDERKELESIITGIITLKGS